MRRKKKSVSIWKKGLILITLFGILAAIPILADKYDEYTYYSFLHTQEDIIEKAQKGVIIVAATDIVDVQTDTPQPNSLGTGFIIGENILLTNNHVVNEAKEVKVDIGSNNGMPYDAIVKYSDKSLDVAVLELKEWDRFKKENEITILEMQEQYRLSQDVYTIGHAWGLLYSVSKGVVSYPYRKMPDDISPRYFIQTDAKIFQGNSGGPMIDKNGNVLGINTMIVVNNGGSYGFTVPSVLINKALQDFTKYGEVRWPVIGIEMENGTVIKNVVPGGAADLAGLQIGDKIIGISVNGDYTTVSNSVDIVKIFAKSDYSDIFQMTIIDVDGDKITLDIMPAYKTAKDLET